MTGQGPQAQSWGVKIDGLTSYGRPHDRLHTFGPYFSSSTVGHLVAGL